MHTVTKYNRIFIKIIIYICDSLSLFSSLHIFFSSYNLSYIDKDNHNFQITLAMLIIAPAIAVVFRI